MLLKLNVYQLSKGCQASALACIPDLLQIQQHRNIYHSCMVKAPSLLIRYPSACTTTPKLIRLLHFRKKQPHLPWQCCLSQKTSPPLIRTQRQRIHSKNLPYGCTISTHAKMPLYVLLQWQQLGQLYDMHGSCRSCAWHIHMPCQGPPGMK